MLGTVGFVNPISKSPPHRKRCKRYNTPGDFHFLTFSCFQRQPFLSKDRARTWFAQAIEAARRKHAFRLIAYVFMPEHAHLLIRPTSKNYDISAILQSLKIPVAQKARSFLVKNAPGFLDRMRAGPYFRFWQAGGGYDRNIFTPEELWEKIRYIHLNPVRRELVTQPTDWHWSSAADFAHIHKGPLPLDNHDLLWTRS